MNTFEVKREWHYTIVENHILDAELSTYAKLLYVILCRYANKNKECYPSYELLMKDIGVKSKTTLSKAIKELIDNGVLEIISGKEEGKSNLYIIKDYHVHDMNKSVHQMNRGCPSDVHELKPYNENQYNNNNNLSAEQTPYKQIMDLFITLCPTLPKIKDISGNRQKVVKARWKEHPDLEFFKELFERVNKSDFLSGRNGKWNGCCFDWIMKPTNMQKIIEGNYDNKNNNIPSHHNEFDFTGL